MALTETKAKVLGALAESERRLTVRELSELTELSERVADQDAAELERSGLAQGNGRGYRITGAGRALASKPVYREYGR
ncbi:hypothetical protein LTT66_18455 [Nocardia gipuzkoensis]|uniref:HTH domain-containing protein n=1 Tax=Nocardia gipuzkoensis TaxID=2749991 RepID=UPI001E33D4C3|nr:HTH domain-containing protein [Nocardia gipuzkoensis]UGT65352.1 hypothetical protein LTT66_18455 [Nocardia gipuzkoensis]